MRIRWLTLSIWMYLQYQNKCLLSRSERGTAKLAHSKCLTFLPVKFPIRTRGIVCISLQNPTPFASPYQLYLLRPVQRATVSCRQSGIRPQPKSRWQVTGMQRSNHIVRVIRSLIIVILLFPVMSTSYVSAQDREISVRIDGRAIAFDVPPMMIDNRVFVPIRAIFEALGAVVKWDAKQRSLEATREGHTIQYSTEGAIINVDSKPIVLDRTAVTVNNRTLVPLRTISQALGSDVNWDNLSRVVSLTTSGATNGTTNESTVPASGSIHFKISSKIKLKLTADARSQTAYRSNQTFSLQVQYYGVKENRFYTGIYFYNNQDKDLRVSFDPGNKQIIAEFSKLKDPMPALDYKVCTIVTNGIAHEDSECTRNNEAEAHARFEEWRKNNFGTSEEGSDYVTVRREVQAADGSLQGYVIPANTPIFFIINSPLPDGSNLTLNGSYFTEGSPDETVPFALDYAIDDDLDLGIYDFSYTSPVFSPRVFLPAGRV